MFDFKFTLSISIVYRTQSLMTGLTGVPANERMNKVDWLNSNNTAAPITQSSGGNHQLYCNVPEHHDLEDCLGQLQYKIEELYDQHETTQVAIIIIIFVAFKNQLFVCIFI